MKKEKIRKRLAAAGAICVMAAVLTGGCANPDKAGAKALENGDYEEAAAQFEQAASSDDAKEAAEGYRGLGMTYDETGDYEAALEAFGKAIDGGAEQTVQLYNLAGISAMQCSDYATALEYIQAGLALADTEPSDQENGEAESYADMIREMKFNEIVCYEQQADWENARQKVTEYLEDYPDDEAAQKEAEFLATR